VTRDPAADPAPQVRGRVVAEPRREHACNPGVTYAWTDGDGMSPAGWYANIPTSSAFPTGTIWACDCGKAYVSLGTPERARDVGHVQTCFWRREHWWERHRRLRGTS
jgi:hypothetical protein